MMYCCGIDVAKCKHAVAILDERGQSFKPIFETENSHAGMDYLVEQLQPWREMSILGWRQQGIIGSLCMMS